MIKREICRKTVQRGITKEDNVRNVTGKRTVMIRQELEPMLILEKLSRAGEMLRLGSFENRCRCNIGFAMLYRTKIWCCCCSISYSIRMVLRVIFCLELLVVLVLNSVD